MYTILLVIALVIVAALAFYAGSLLYKLQKQKQLRIQNTQQRIDNITQSIQTISLAMEQQQCNFSEGCIRLIHLLEALPVLEKPDYSKQFVGLYALFNKVKDLPTHEARKSQSKIETKHQDIAREELEAQLESQILKDVAVLKTFVI